MSELEQEEDELKGLYRDNYLQYASYVILDRAIPDVVDGLKPVQRRILHTLYRMDDGRLHKVMNVAGQTMALHPHGDAPIVDALVHMANKEYLLNRQGNFGNPLTGDRAAAGRYIETSLSKFAKKVLFNPDLTEMIPSYDGRNKEPVRLPAKVPLVLLQGSEGIAVGMSTKILPHNFVELLEAEIAVLQKKPYELYPDFPTGGLMDVSEYDQGRGRVRLRTRLEIKDPKTIVIREVCFGTTTESLIRSIDEAAKQGKIKIDSIHDYSTGEVEVEIQLLRGQYAKDMVEELYAFTECEVSIKAQMVVIKDDLPWEADVAAVLEHHAEQLKALLQRELEIEEERLLENVFQKTLERIFIENRLYKKIEEVKTYEAVHESIEKSLKPFHKELLRKPTKEDRERLLSIPLRKITRYDIERNREEIAALEERLEEVRKHLKQITRYAVRYLKDLIREYGEFHPRRTEITEMEVVDRKSVARRPVKVAMDANTGFIGTKVKGEHILECTTFDKVLVVFEDGTYQVVNIEEKRYLAKKPVVHIAVADKKSVFSAVYREKKTQLACAKRFVVRSFILDRVYRYIPEESTLLYFTVEPGVLIRAHLIPKPRARVSKVEFSLDSAAVKGVAAKGIRISSRPVKRVSFIKVENVEPAKSS